MSDEQIHTTNAQPVQPPPTDNWFVENLKKQIITVAFGAVWGFYTFVYNAHDSQKDLGYLVDTNTKAIEKIVIAQKEQSDTMSNFLIALTKVSEAQNRLAADVRDIQEQQRKNTEMLINRK